MNEKEGKLVVENGDLSLSKLKEVYNTGFSNSVAQQQRKKVIGERIKDIRKSKGIKQKELCERIGVMITTFSGYENGKHDVPAEIIVRICDLFDISADYILGRTKNPKGLYFSKEDSNIDDLQKRIDEVQRLLDELR